MLRWNGTIAQDQDQPVFKKSSPGRSLSTKGSSRASEQNRFAVRLVHIMLSGGIALTSWADRMFSTCPPTQGHQLI